MQYHPSHLVELSTTKMTHPGNEGKCNNIRNNSYNINNTFTSHSIHQLQNLPPELYLHILSNVDIPSLCAVSETCKEWYGVIENTDYLWQILCQLHCDDWRDVTEDRASGYSWKETLQRNFGHHAIKRKWLRGDFSSFKSYAEVPSKILCFMDRETWGQILEVQLTR